MSYADQEREIWSTLSPSDRAALLDPAIEQMASAADSLQEAADSLSGIGADIKSANAALAEKMTSSVKATGEMLASAAGSFTGKDMASALGQIAAEQERSRKTMVGVLEVMMAVNQRLEGVEAALTAPKRIVFKDGKPVGVEIG